jgi:hypothetical protein
MRAGALRRVLGLSTSGFKRALSAAGPWLLSVGKARATTYAVRRAIEGVSTPVPVFEVMEDGTTRHALNLHPVEPWGFYVEGLTDQVSSAFIEDDLPWFLQDIRPVGYLGRAWVRSHPEAGYPLRLDQWRGDHAIQFATQWGTDLLGAFVIGRFALSRVAVGDVWRRLVEQEGRAEIYADLAMSTALYEQGSSPGGEQPKFTATRVSGERSTPVIVKFTAPEQDATTQRWADLLRSEHLALRTVQDHGFPAAASQVLTARGCTFLEVERFDRTPAGGRVGMISLLALDREQVGSDLRSWSVVTAHLAPAIHEHAQWLEAFGHLIANSDMHLGNLSLLLRGTQVVGLAPVYDMLPMHYAPRPGASLHPAPYQPWAHRRAFPASAVEAARDYWGRVAGDGEISADFRALARVQAEVVERGEGLSGGLRT